MLILLLFHFSPSSAFFFPMGGGNCQCPVCPQPTACAPQMACAIPLPCPTAPNYVAPAPQFETQYQGSYQPVVPVDQSVTVPVLAPPRLIQPAAISAYLTPELQSQSSASYFNPSYYSYAPTYQALPASYHTVTPTSEASYIVPEVRVTNPVQPIQPVQTVVATDYSRGDAVEDRRPPSYPASSLGSQYLPDPPDHTSIVAFDETAPVLPPPVPTEPSSYSSSFAGNKATTDENTGISLQDNEAQLVPAASTAATLVYDAQRSVAERWSAYQQSLHSGSTDDPWSKRRVSTEGFAPLEMFHKRNMILKRMKNARQLAATVPRTNTTCNSHKLANVMVRVMVDDVSISKRTILRATEMAFDGDKFDVFCASGEFSYSIHSRKYCEVTRDNVTCFAFR